MTITTILPTFERPKLLRKAIESVLNQTFGDFILRIYDNHSNDDTPQVVAEYSKRDPRICYFRREKNIGPIANWSLALRDVKTAYFSFLSDDDFLLPNFYECALEGFKKYPDVGFSAGRTLLQNQKGKMLRAQFLYQPLNGYFHAGLGIEDLLLPHCFPTWTGILFKSQILESIGGIHVEAGYALDMEFTLRYAAYAPFVINAQPVAVLMKWSLAASNAPTSIYACNFDLFIDKLENYYKGPLERLSQVRQKLQEMKRGMYKHTWIHSLLAHHVKNAKEARLAFLEAGGEIVNWKLKCLKQCETKKLMRWVFIVYKKVAHAFNNYCR